MQGKRGGRLIPNTYGFSLMCRIKKQQLCLSSNANNRLNPLAALRSLFSSFWHADADISTDYFQIFYQTLGAI